MKLPNLLLRFSSKSGYNDLTCPPTSMYSAYNVITAPKELYIFQETGHWTFPEQAEALNSWLLKKLKGQ